MQEEENKYRNDLEELQKLEKRYCSLMKQAYEAGVKDRAYSDELNDRAMSIKKQIDAIRTQVPVI